MTEIEPEINIMPRLRSRLSEGENPQGRIDDDTGSETDPAAFIPTPPDGGWGWVICIASFFANLIVDGIAYSFGVFLIEFSDYFQESKGKVAWIGSLLSGCYLSVGPLVSALTNKFGCRAVMMSGSFVAGLAFVVSTFSTNVTILMVTYGIVGGIGFGLIYLPAIVSVGYYFEKKRALATGLAVCGSGVGTFVMAPVSQLLLNFLTWQGATLVLAGIIFNCAVCGSLMRPLELSQKVEKKKPLLLRMKEAKEARRRNDSECSAAFYSIQDPDKYKAYNFDVGVHSHLDLHLMNKLNINDRRDYKPSILIEEVIQADGKLSSQDKLNKNGLTQNAATAIEEQTSLIQKEMVSNGGINSGAGVDDKVLWQKASPDKEKVKKSDLARPMYRADIFYSGSIVNLPQFRSQANVSNYLTSVISIPKSVPIEEEKGIWKFLRLPKSMKDTMKSMLSFDVLKNPAFIIICISNIFGMLGFYIPFVYIVDYAGEQGVGESDAALLLSIIGITNTIGRIFFGWFSDQPWVNSLHVNNVCLIIGGVCTFFCPLCNDFMTLAIVCALFGFFISAYIALTSIILVDTLGLEFLTNAFGILILFRGAASIIGSPVAGFLYDATGSYSIPFFAAGSLMIVSGIITCFIPFLHLCGHVPPVVECIEELNIGSARAIDDMPPQESNLDTVVEEEPHEMKEIETVV